MTTRIPNRMIPEQWSSLLLRRLNRDWHDELWQSPAVSQRGSHRQTLWLREHIQTFHRLPPDPPACWVRHGALPIVAMPRNPHSSSAVPRPTQLLFVGGV